MIYLPTKDSVIGIRIVPVLIEHLMTEKFSLTTH